MPHDRGKSRGVGCSQTDVGKNFSNPHPAAPPDAFPELTEREREILELLARHETNPEIAKRLHLSPKTVRNHVSNIFDKLQVAGRAEAIVRARDAGLGG